MSVRFVLTVVSWMAVKWLPRTNQAFHVVFGGEDPAFGSDWVTLNQLFQPGKCLGLPGSSLGYGYQLL